MGDLYDFPNRDRVIESLETPPPRHHHDDGGDDGMDARIAALETGMQEVRTTLGRMEPLLARIDERLNHTATKAELAEKPSKTYLWGIVGALVATVLAATGVGATIAALLK